MVLTHKYRIKNKSGKKVLARMSRSVNLVWNFCVATQKKVQQIRKQGSSVYWPNYYALNQLTSGSSKDLSLHAQTIQETCDQFVKSRDRHKKCPKFRKSLGPRKSLGWIPFQKQSRQITKDSVKYLGKTYRVFGAKRRPIPANAKGGCFVEDSRGKWYVCFQVEVDQLPTGSGDVGIDLGLKILATCSDGTKIGNPRGYRKLEQKLKVAQRAKKTKRVKALHAKIKKARRDHLHKESNRLAKANRLIVVGDVSSSKLAKTRMAKSVLDAGWSMFRNMLQYKASRHAARYVVVNENFTTQTCSRCGSVASNGRPRGIAGLGIREWVCSDCGVIHDRDVNAAKNILALGLSHQPPAGGSLTKGIR